MSSESHGPWVRALAPAKINLFLELVGKRADGYHELDTWMLALELCDEVALRLRPAPGLALSVEGPQASADIAADERNLVWRAARAALAVLGCERGLEIRLTKRIPSQSGLGGGSADAAAAVLAVEAALGARLEQNSRRALALELGSDCAFFLEAEASGFARCGGRGELVRALPPLPRAWVVAILAPEVRCSTAEVYAATRIPLSGPARLHSLPAAWFDVPAASARRSLFNRLELAALEVAPELRSWRGLFDALEARHVRMTGSGSAFYALCADRAEGQALVERSADEARRRGLGLRGHWVLDPAGHGAKLAKC